MTTKFTSDELKDFAEKLPELGITNEATARNLRNSSLLLLSTIPDGKYDDISSIDVEELINTYLQSADSEPSEASIQTYRSRFKSLIAKFNEYKGIRPSSDNESEASQPSRIGAISIRRPPKPPRRAKSIEETVASRNNDTLEGSILTNHTFDAQFLLRPETGLSIELKGLPLDLTNEEAERIASFLKIYVRPQ